VTLEVDLCREFCVINFDGPLFICTKEEQRAVILFLWAEGVLGAEMYRRISVQYGNSVVSQRMVYEWIEGFKNGRTIIKHEEGARRRAYKVLVPGNCAFIAFRTMGKASKL
jgi:hypothetical protein